MYRRERCLAGGGALTGAARRGRGGQGARLAGMRKCPRRAQARAVVPAGTGGFRNPDVYFSVYISLSSAAYCNAVIHIMPRGEMV